MSEERHPLIAELEQRIHELEQHAEDAFGHFNRLDWWICVTLGLLLPVALLLWFWP